MKMMRRKRKRTLLPLKRLGCELLLVNYAFHSMVQLYGGGEVQVPWLPIDDGEHLRVHDHWDPDYVERQQPYI